ncbi:MAG: hypothetical protein KY466_12485 [Gemmatimonadetes bacterium]|nr:hypothetical protein [Gemmatimonadota bacterium]
MQTTNAHLDTQAYVEPGAVDEGPPVELPLLEEQPGGTHLLELWSDRDEAQALPELLRPDEGVVCVASGTVVRSGRLAQPRWLIVLTDRRLLCIKGRVAAARRVIDMPVSAIRSVQRKGLLRSTLTLDTGYGNLRLSGLKKNLAAELTDGLEALIRAHRGHAAVAGIRRADLPENGGGEAVGLAESVASLRTEVAELRAEVAELRAGLTSPEVASGDPSP